MCATASILVISSEIINLILRIYTLDIIVNQATTIPTITRSSPIETDFRTF